MDPMTIMALAQLVMGAAGATQKGIASIKQGKEAKELSGLKRPAYMIPQEAKTALQTAQMAYNNPIMEGDMLENNQIENTTANALATAGKVGASSGDQLAALGGAMAQENTAKISAYQNAIANKNQLMNTYLGELGNMSGLKEKAFDWNTAQSYLNTMKAAQALKQTSQANAGGALQDVVTGLGAGANTMLQNKTLSGITGEGLTAENQLASQAAEKAQEAINPIDRTPQNLSTLLGQKIEPLTVAQPKSPSNVLNEKAEQLGVAPNIMDNTVLNSGTQIDLKPKVLNPTKIVTPTGKVVSNTKDAENLIDNDAAFNEASGKAAYEDRFSSTDIPSKKFDFSGNTTKELEDRLAQLTGNKKFDFSGKSTDELQKRLNELEKKQLYSKLISNPQLLQAILGK